MNRLLRIAKERRVQIVCRRCRRPGDIESLLKCSGCGRGGIFHRVPCWNEWPEHQPSSGINPVEEIYENNEEPCESTEMMDHIWISHLLDSKIPPDKQKALHRKDLWATWFGVPYFQKSAQLFTYGRLQALLQRHGGLEESKTQYPSLVSVFGDTGGGKSTIIRALIKNAETTEGEFATPVPGSVADLLKSTSSDVHLYADPLSIASSVPLFYAGKSTVKEK
jgi:hypothetical protein